MVRERRIFVALVVILSLVLLLPVTVAPAFTQSPIPLTIRVAQPSARPISVFVESRNNLDADKIRLLSNYGTVTTVAGPVAVLQTQAASLIAISRLPFLTRIERAHSLSVDLDKSVPDVGATAVWNEVRDPYRRDVTGAGVIVGFVDTGIDTMHPDFSFPNGTTKLLYVWDQTTPGRPPDGFGYGYECASGDIQAGSCPETDNYGHGTHVAGIAASSGMATGNYTGVAPFASIIFVKSGHSVCNGSSWTFDDTQILDGISYMVKKASQLHMRLVVNLSLGGNIGGHDGTDSLERGLEAYVEAGTPIVVAAGNEARDNDHIRGQLSQGKDVTFQIGVRETTIGLQIDVWYSLKDQVEATFVTPDGRSYLVPTPPRGMTSIYGNVTAVANTGEYGKELYLEVNSATSLPSNGWSVTLRPKEVHSQGFWDAWVDASTCSYPGVFFVAGEGYDIDPYGTIGLPGTARSVVTVGAYVSKTSWKGMNGLTFGRTDVPTGGIASFSSLGPTRDGRIKPDVVAPGATIASARSRAIPQRDSDPDAFHRMLAGTSMATPHVTGTVALMLQYAPKLQATEIPRILRETARLDAHTGLLTSGSPTWGSGKVDARTATALFRLTLVTRGVSIGINIPVNIDGNQTRKVPSATWTDLYFYKGTSHIVSFASELHAGPGIRYELQNGSFVVNANSMKILNYATQYLFTVNSQNGTTLREEWYNANTTVRLSAPERLPASGVLRYTRAEYVLAYWNIDGGQVISDKVVMNAPRTVKAVYVLTFPMQTFIMAILIATAVVVSVVLLARKYMS